MVAFRCYKKLHALPTLVELGYSSILLKEQDCKRIEEVVMKIKEVLDVAYTGSHGWNSMASRVNG